MNGESPVNNTLDETVAKLNAEFKDDDNAAPTTTTTHEVPRKVLIWGMDKENGLPNVISTTNNVSHGTPPSYRDATRGTSTPQRNSN